MLLGHEMSAKNAFDVVQFALPRAVSAGVVAVPTDHVRTAQPLVQTTFMEFDAQLSSNGRYFAYHSNESGRDEIYVRPYPAVNAGRWQVSTGGGTRAAWAHSGRELFYIDATGTLTSVAVTTDGPTFTAGNPAAVFATRYRTLVNVRNYDVSADDRRFLMIKQGPANDATSLTHLVVVLNWIEELKIKLPEAR